MCGSDKSEDTTLLTAIFTYSTDWTRRYFAKQYVNTDPVIAFGRDAVVPFDWETLVGDNPAVRAFFDDAANHGVGRNGLSIPVRNRRGITRSGLLFRKSVEGRVGSVQKREH